MMDRFKKEVKHMNSELGDVQFKDPDEDAEIIFNTILDNKKKEAARQGREEGIKEGIKEANNDAAKKMKLKGIDVNIISEITGLSIKEIKNL